MTVSLLNHILSIRRHSTWSLDSLTPLAGDIGHPQGLTIHNGNWVVTSVHPSSGRGMIGEFDRSGTRVRAIDVTDSERIHPGGIDWSPTATSMWVPVAEYRPHSTSTVMRIDTDFRISERFAVDDHIGAICQLGDGTLLAVSWGSRDLYRLSVKGDVLERRANPSHLVDYQDLQVLEPGFVLATGVTDLDFSGDVRQLGGLAILDATDLRIVHEVPVAVAMPSGRSITYNGCHVDEYDHRIRFNCLVDDTKASIGHWIVN